MLDIQNKSMTCANVHLGAWMKFATLMYLQLIDKNGDGIELIIFALAFHSELQCRL